MWESNKKATDIYKTSNRCPASFVSYLFIFVKNAVGCKEQNTTAVNVFAIACRVMNHPQISGVCDLSIFLQQEV